LRGLDTIEDDMTIPLEKKEPELRTFDQKLFQPGWTFNDSGPNEKDSQLLVEFDKVILEFGLIKPAYQKIIADMTKQMGKGMADYVVAATVSVDVVKTVADYDLYCHYVAGLVGEGLTKLFVEAKLANPVLLERPELHESMGLFLQKTNIIRDVREDFDDGRRFYPKTIWSKHTPRSDPDDFPALFNAENRADALNCSSEMVLDALRHVDDCLYYLAGLKEQSVFNFCAIPQAMAVATLELTFRNPAVWERNVKITKGDACHIMIESTQNLQVAAELFRTYVRKIQKRNDPRDPNFVSIAVACGKIEQGVQRMFPVPDPKKGEVVGARTEKERERDEEAKWDTSEFYLTIKYGHGTGADERASLHWPRGGAHTGLLGRRHGESFPHPANNAQSFPAKLTSTHALDCRPLPVLPLNYPPILTVRPSALGRLHNGRALRCRLRPAPAGQLPKAQSRRHAAACAGVRRPEIDAQRKDLRRALKIWPHIRREEAKQPMTDIVTYVLCITCFHV